MSAAVARRILWLALVVLVPVPYWGIEVERAPVARLGLFAVVTTAAAVSEGGGVAWLLAGAFWLQGLLYAAAFLLVARVTVRRLPVARRGVMVVAVVAVLLGVSFLDVFHTPFTKAAPTTNVLGIFR